MLLCKHHIIQISAKYAHTYVEKSHKLSYKTDYKHRKKEYTMQQHPISQSVVHLLKVKRKQHVKMSYFFLLENVRNKMSWRQFLFVSVAFVFFKTYIDIW